jgi:serine/threonine protein kinase
MPLAPGATFGRYKIIALLGQGGMGVVYRAHDTHLDRTVALKVLHATDSVRGDGDSGAARLLREGRAAAAILHPNAVAIFDVGEWEGTTFLAMELVEGRTLRGYVGDSRVPLGRRIKWLVDIASALSAAHKRGVVHRDVKPENVIVREDKEVKVLDFGIARRAPAGVPIVTGESVPRDSTVFGSPRYMAPEQLRGEPLDGNTDQFAWGVLAYELLTGRHPWEGATTDAQLAKTIFHREPVAPSVRNALIPPAIDETVLRAIAKAPSARFGSIEAAAARLRKAGAHLETSDEAPEEEKTEDASAAASPAEGMRSVTTRTFGITAVFAPIGSTRRRVVQASLAMLVALAIGGVAIIRYRASITHYALADSSVDSQIGNPAEQAADGARRD